MPHRGAARTPYVFVSYASVDRERVLPVVEALRDSGVDVWIDQADIAGGAVYGPEIVDGIEGCAALALMCSAASLASPNVRQEIALAWKYRRPYLPLLLDPVAIPREVEYWLEGAQWIELLDHPVDVWLPRLSQALGRLIPDGSPPEIVTGPTKVSSSPALFDVPVPLTPIIGREKIITNIVDLTMSDATRLITLTGVGGTGKTRLALAIAKELRDDFTGDIVFVDLAPVHDAHLVSATIASRLGIQVMGDQPVLTALTQALARRRLLLILDNLEQVIESAPEIATLLGGCPDLRVLATSCAPLLISGEQEYPVSPLAAPDLEDDAGPEDVARSDAVRLFVQQARSVRPDFQITDDNATAIALICVRLDGLPLAIELAASRIRLMSPQALLDRLDRRLPLLTSGRRDVPARQRTLRDTIAWSYDLLQPEEQVLFRRLSVFVGGWTLAAAEAVTGTDVDVYGGLETLVTHSLVRVVDAVEPRYTMLETIREFGLEQLSTSGEEDVNRERHAAWVRELVDDVAPLTKGPGLIAAMNRLAAEHPNIRAALEWFIDRRDAESGWRIAGHMWLFWWMRNHLREGHGYYRRLLDLPRNGVPLHALARGLTSAGIITEWLDNLDEAISLQEEALQLWEHAPFDLNADGYWSLACLFNIAMRRGDHELARTLAQKKETLAEERGDDYLLAMASVSVGVYKATMGELAETEAVYRKGLAHARRCGNPWAISLILGNLTGVLMQRGDLADVGTNLDEMIEINRAMGHVYQTAGALAVRSEFALLSGRPLEALEDAKDALVLMRQLGDAYHEAGALTGTGRILTTLERWDEALADYQECLALTREHGFPESSADALEGIATRPRVHEQPRQALRLAAAASAIRNAHGIALTGSSHEESERLVTILRSELPESDFATEWATGAAMSMDEAIAYALDQS